jgi:hypothetical protein
MNGNGQFSDNRDGHPFRDIPSIEVPGVGAARIRAQRAKKRKQRFVMVPLVWVDRLMNAKLAATCKVALHILHTSWKRKSSSFPLSNRGLPGVDRKAKSRALKELELLGLVVIERRSQRSPIVTVL